MKNKYIQGAKLSEAKFRELVRCFCLDLDAGQIAVIIRVNRNTVNRYLSLFRHRISGLCEQGDLSGSTDAFKTRLRSLPICESPGKRNPSKEALPVFGIMERGGHVITEILPQQIQGYLQSALKTRSSLGAAGHILRFGGYQALMYFECEKPYSLAEDRPYPFFTSAARTEPIWLFWLFTRKRLSKFQGISKSTFGLHLKECEFRFNARGRDIYAMLLKEFRMSPIARSGPASEDAESAGVGGPGNTYRKKSVGRALQDFPAETSRSLSVG